jgi:serine/threonine protein kinase
MPSLDELLARAGLEIVQRDIGGGGSATVHKCQVIEPSERLPEVGHLVAAKEYRADILKVPQQLHRIRQESELGASLKHENIVRTFGLLGESERESDSGTPLVLLLEWIEGRTLDVWFAEQEKPVPWDSVSGIGRDLVRALVELHSLEVFHRDVKPENVMVRRSGATVLMDIGVAELSGSDESTLHTSVKDFIGSARYASPQFIMGVRPFASTDDVYGLGATLFLLFTGSAIYAEVERKSVIPIYVVNEQPVLNGLAGNVPATMKVLLLGMLQRDEKRRPSLAEVGECLENADASPYLTKELSRQANDIRSYVVLQVDRGSFFADLAGDTPEVNETYTVVHPMNKEITVPSYNRAVTPEVWVADATLKHIHQNVGHFAIHTKKWRDVPGSFALASLSSGQWVHDEGNEMKVSSGDLVLKKKQR